MRRALPAPRLWLSSTFMASAIPLNTIRLRKIRQLTTPVTPWLVISSQLNHQYPEHNQEMLRHQRKEHRVGPQLPVERLVEIQAEQGR